LISYYLDTIVYESVYLKRSILYDLVLSIFYIEAKGKFCRLGFKETRLAIGLFYFYYLSWLLIFILVLFLIDWNTDLVVFVFDFWRKYVCFLRWGISLRFNLCIEKDLDWLVY